MKYEHDLKFLMGYGIRKFFVVEGSWDTVNPSQRSEGKKASHLHFTEVEKYKSTLQKFC